MIVLDTDVVSEAMKPEPDLADGQAREEPAFLDDEGPSVDIPLIITTTNARRLFDLREGETVSEAISRHSAKVE